jgi:aspartyl-tRNA synthetase
VIKGIVVPNAAFSRKELDDLNPLAVSFGAKGLAWVRVTEAGWQSPLAKFVSAEQRQHITATLALKPADLLLMVADQEKTVSDVVSRLRLYLGEKLGLIPKD